MAKPEIELRRKSASSSSEGNPLAKRAKAVSGRYQDLKFTLHRKLLDKINLDALATIETDALREQVRGALTGLVDGEQTLLSTVERNQVVEEVLDEVFGLGPLEPLLQDGACRTLWSTGTNRSMSSAGASSS